MEPPTEEEELCYYCQRDVIIYEDSLVSVPLEGVNAEEDAIMKPFLNDNFIRHDIEPQLSCYWLYVYES